MNYLIYNNNFVAENNFVLSPFNRAFCYGDGLFETMVFKEGKLLFLEDHLYRIQEGLKELDISFPASLTKDFFHELITALVEKNNLHHNARIKLQVWRKQGGLISPESTEADYIILASEYKKTQEVKENAFVSEKIKLKASSLSKYKTLNFLPYIQAGIEKKKRNVDEIILTDNKGNVAEASSCNLFWGKSDMLFTPALETGCIEGIMRKQIIRFCEAEKIKVTEGLFPLSELMNAELVFTSNVSGLSLVSAINSKKIDTQYTLYQAIRIGLDLL
jgi:4-amino-4-deoxychorismate lyase